MAFVASKAPFEHHLVSADLASENHRLTPPSMPTNVVCPWSNESWLCYILPSQPELAVNSTDLISMQSKSVWNRLEPAMTLASILMQRAEPLLAHIYCGPLTQTATSKFQLSPYWTARKADYVLLDKAMLNFRRGGYRFCFLPRLPLDETDHLSETAIVLDTGRHHEGYKLFTGISQDFYDIISADQFETIPIANQRCVYAVLALTMIQELAHALWMQRWIDQNPNHSSSYHTAHIEIPPEPTMGHNRYRNLGMAISHELFGLEFTFPRRTIPLPGGLPPPPSFNRRLILDGSAGLQAGTRDAKGRIKRRFTLTTQSIRSFFDCGTWFSRMEEFRTFPTTLKLYLIPETLEPDETLPSSDEDGPYPTETKVRIKMRRQPSVHNIVIPTKEELALRQLLRRETARRLMEQQF